MDTMHEMEKKLAGNLPPMQIPDLQWCAAESHCRAMLALLRGDLAMADTWTWIAKMARLKIKDMQENLADDKVPETTG